MKLRFTKMHGLGNDFVMVDAISQRVTMTPERARTLADRHFGVGCDQVLVVEPPNSPDSDFCYRIFNHDGEEVENCGNGARCFALFVRQRRLTGRRTIRVDTAAGVLVLQVHEDNQVTVDMGVPECEPAKIPFSVASKEVTYSLTVKGEAVAARTLSIGAVSMGNPHAVTVVQDIAVFPVQTIGPLVERHRLFPRRVNAGFMQVVTPTEIQLRVYERGAGETLACGTGACAAVVVGQLQGLLKARVQVHLPGGALSVEWAGGSSSVYMTGPATIVYHGQINI